MHCNRFFSMSVWCFHHFVGEFFLVTLVINMEENVGCCMSLSISKLKIGVIRVGDELLIQKKDLKFVLIEKIITRKPFNKEAFNSTLPSESCAGSFDTKSGRKHCWCQFSPCLEFFFFGLLLHFQSSTRLGELGGLHLQNSDAQFRILSKNLEREFRRIGK